MRALVLALAPCLLLASVLDAGPIVRVGDTLRESMPGLDEIELPSPRPRPRPKGEAVKVSMMALKNARWRRGGPVEDWVEELDGQKVVLSGYMAIGTLEGLTRFELVPESCECGKSKINHFVEVTLTEDTTRFIPGRFKLEGIFDVGERYEDGFLTSLYRLEATQLP